MMCFMTCVHMCVIVLAFVWLDKLKREAKSLIHTHTNTHVHIGSMEVKSIFCLFRNFEQSPNTITKTTTTTTTKIKIKY